MRLINYKGLLLFCAVLYLGVLGAEEYDPTKAHYGIVRDHYDLGHLIKITTNSIKAIDVKLEWTKDKNDRFCERGGGTTTSFEISSSGPYKSTIEFSLKGSPQIALCEWHVCLTINDTTYLGWRGFDPGPETQLEITCFVDTSNVNTRDRSIYLCKTNEIVWNQENHQEYAEFCWTEGVCRRFETKPEYRHFLEGGTQNASFIRTKKPLVISKTKVKKRQLSQQEWETELEKTEKEDQQSCYELFSNADDNLQPRYSLNKCLEDATSYVDSMKKEEPPYVLEDSEVLGKFPQISGLVVVDEFTHHPLSMTVGDELSRKTISFAAHQIQNQELKYHQIFCTYEYDAKFAHCELTVEHAYFAQDPDRHFAVEEKTNVDVATWAAQERLQTPIERNWKYPDLNDEENEESFQRMKTYLEGNPRVAEVTERKGIVTFKYRGYGCYYSSDYRIIGAMEALEYYRTQGICF